MLTAPSLMLLVILFREWHYGRSQRAVRLSCGGSRAALVRAVLVLSWAGVPARCADVEVEFNRDVQPILAEHCLLCHGPDQEQRQGGLRLDLQSAAMQGGDSGQPAIIPGEPAGSQLISRILTTDPDEVMPPPVHGKPLTVAQKETLQQWVRDGAAFQRHWSLVPPQRIPVSDSGTGSGNAIDRLVSARLKARKLAVEPAASVEELCRRLYLALIGLPPSVEQLQVFVERAAEDRSAAVDELVDQLLASPQFGVRWARHWLDLARYADSHGFQRDDLRDIWPYRDWVVDAMNSDMPFDQFTIEQIAGDLLPNATESQHIATGFNRCTTCNVEAGTEPEENRVNQVFDRVNTFGAVWLGLTLECAQCHDHKFDPISMQDYYRLFAYFNQTEIEAQRANPSTPGSIRFLGPYRTLESSQADREAQQIQDELHEIRSRITGREQQLTAGSARWESELQARLDELAAAQVLDVVQFKSAAGSTIRRLDDGSVLLVDEATPANDTYTITATTALPEITALKIETLTDPSLPGKGPGRGDAERPNFVLNNVLLEAIDVKTKQLVRPVKFVSAWASFSQINYSVKSLLSGPSDSAKNGWAISPQFHKPHWALLAFERPLRNSDGLQLKIRLVQKFGGGRTIGRLRLSAVTGDPSLAAIPADVAAALRVSRDARSQTQQEVVARFRRDSDSQLATLRATERSLEKRLEERPVRRSLVMVEREQRRASTMFERGVYSNAGAAVEPGTPAALHPSNAGGGTRLDLAKWIVSDQNPLTARVVVNRWWAELLGRGLVPTPEDFGAKGVPPVYPELLDLLAIELVEHGWSMKHVIRLIVTSDTFQRSSRATSAALAIDDHNEWLARGPRFRMDAEMIRDNALAIAGLLSLERGGPPIRPPQPAGLWTKVGGEKYDYLVSKGEREHRRGLYVVLKRGSPYPSFVNFDASARMSCIVRRSRSNTPLQALTLLNDPVYVEAARAFADRIVQEGGMLDDERIQWGFRTAVARWPGSEELQILRELLTAERAQAGESAAWFAVAAALLNLDETITRG
jgi:hypothetical protein